MRTYRLLMLLGVALNAACGVPSLEAVAPRSAGDDRVAIEHDDEARSLELHLPARGLGSPAPLLVVLHGGGSSGESMAAVTGFNAIADREGFVVAYPDAIGFSSGYWRLWNTGDLFGPASWFGVDDVGMVAALIDELSARIVIDPERIYIVGYSNGGSLAYQLAARMSDRLAAVAVYAATMSANGPVIGPRIGERPPAAALSVMTIQSARDGWVAPNGRERLQSTDASLIHVGQFWAAAAGCPSRARRYTSHGGAVQVRHFRNCPGGVEIKQLLLFGWDHEWPGPVNLRSCKAEDDPLRSFDAAEIMWAFFAGKRRAPAEHVGQR